jgi:hypothetical protein
MHRRGSPIHRGQTAISGCIVLGTQTGTPFNIHFCTKTSFFIFGFLTACGAILLLLWPHFDE